MSFEKPRVFRAVEFQYRLVNHNGVSATTQSKRWYFELPAERDSDEGWSELLNRVIYDANTLMRRQEPDDLAWLKLDSFEVSAVDTDLMMVWGGDTGDDALGEHLPWFLADRKVLWEFAACYIVDDAGRYDGVSAFDYSELQLYRREAAGVLDVSAAVAFLSRLFPKTATRGQEIWAARAARLKNIDVIRPTRHARRAVGSRPYVSGPPAE